METPRQGRADGPLCRIEVFEPWVAALDTLAQFAQIEVLYWLHLSRRDLVMQSPANDGTSRGTFSLRSPARPNPIGTSSAKLVSIERATVMVRGLDCLHGTRHLLRLWLAPPGARRLPPVFAECYGDLTIGDRGGIICKGTRLHAPLTQHQPGGGAVSSIERLTLG